MLTPFLAFADSFWTKLEILTTSFEGNGEILSFDVNENGEVLICVQETSSHHYYFMILDVEGNLSCSLCITSPLQTYGKFGEEGTIVLFLQKSSLAWEIDRAGNLINEYHDIDIERGRILRQYRCVYGDMEFIRNNLHSKIIVRAKGIENVFFEISIGKSNSLFLFAICLLVIVLGFAFLLIQKSKRKTPDGG